MTFTYLYVYYECVCVCVLYIDLMICNDTLRGVPLLLLANKQDLEVCCFMSLILEWTVSPVECAKKI